MRAWRTGHGAEAARDGPSGPWRAAGGRRRNRCFWKLLIAWLTSRMLRDASSNSTAGVGPEPVSVTGPAQAELAPARAIPIAMNRARCPRGTGRRTVMDTRIPFRIAVPTWVDCHPPLVWCNRTLMWKKHDFFPKSKTTRKRLPIHAHINAHTQYFPRVIELAADRSILQRRGTELDMEDGIGVVFMQHRGTRPDVTIVSESGYGKASMIQGSQGFFAGVCASKDRDAEGRQLVRSAVGSLSQPIRRKSDIGSKAEPSGPRLGKPSQSSSTVA